jgi:membrane protein YdbS with pleckstrin-like domain
VTRVLRLPAGPPRVPDGGYQSVEVVRASSRYLRYRLLSFYVGAGVAGFAFLLAAVAAVAAGKAWVLGVVALVAAPIAVVLALAWFAVRLEYDLRYYVITDRSLRVREGAWSLAEMTLTYANVQNVRIEQGPLQRLFRISDLVVDTAGGGAPSRPGHGAASGHNVRLAGLEDAHAVRDLVLAHVKRFSRSSGLGDLDDAGARDRRGGLGPVGAGARSAVGPALIAAAGELRACAGALRRTAEAGTRDAGSA